MVNVLTGYGEVCGGFRKLLGRSAALGVRRKMVMVGPNHLSLLALDSGFPQLPATRTEPGYPWGTCGRVLQPSEGPSAPGLSAFCEWDYLLPLPLIGRWWGRQG